MNRLAQILAARPDLQARLARLRAFAAPIRSSEYHLTHACNLRCHGCWFFEFDFDKKTGSDVTKLDEWQSFARRERERGVSLAILIGGEPALVPERIRAFAREMPYVWVSTNGLRPIPREGLENIAISITLFGGGPLDDALRGYGPGGKKISNLFETALENFKGDDRTFFVYALSLDSLPYLEDTVKRIGAVGSQVLFNFYGEYAGPTSDGSLAAGGAQPRHEREALLLEKALEVRAKYPDTVLSHPYYIRTLIEGKSHWGQPWGFDVCPSVSQNHPENRERIANGNPTLPGFNAFAPDMKTVNRCCTSGHCENCRDSQAVMSWLLLSMAKFTDSPEQLQTWLEVSESFWRQFCWSPYHRTSQGREAAA